MRFGWCTTRWGKLMRIRRLPRSCTEYQLYYYQHKNNMAWKLLTPQTVRPLKILGGLRWQRFTGTSICSQRSVSTWLLQAGHGRLQPGICNGNTLQLYHLGIRQAGMFFPRRSIELGAVAPVKMLGTEVDIRRTDVLGSSATDIYPSLTTHLRDSYLILSTNHVFS